MADGTHIYEDDDVDLSAQPAGTSMVWRNETANTKDLMVHAMLLQW